MNNSNRLIRIILGILFSLIILLLVFGESRTSMAAGMLRNLGHNRVFSQLFTQESACPDENQIAMSDLERAMHLLPDKAYSWRTLLRAAGWTDREWIAAQLHDMMDSGWVDPQTIQSATSTLLPPWQAMRDPWDKYRCQAANAAWTLGRVNSSEEQLQNSVAAYQAGLSLAPCRAGGYPEGILSSPGEIYT